MVVGEHHVRVGEGKGNLRHRPVVVLADLKDSGPLRSLFVTPLSRFATLSTTAHKTRERMFSALWPQLEDRKKLSDLVQLAAPLLARPRV